MSDLCLDSLQQWRSTLSITGNDRARWHNCYCDECGVNVVGVRYKCLICTGYDLCQACIDQHSSTGHALIRITSPSDSSWELCYMWSQLDDDVVAWAFLCKCFQKYMQDTYTIEQMKKMDIESACNDTTTMEGVNRINDQFVSVVEAMRTAAYQCDECDRDVEGVRLTCITCDGYDLCEKCEKAHRHDNHAMIRIVQPDDHNWLMGWFFARTPIAEFLIDQYLSDPEDPVPENDTNGGGDPGHNSTCSRPKISKPRRRFRLSPENIRFAIGTALQVIGIAADVAGSR